MRWAVVAILVGCYSPNPQPGAPCSTLGSCPAGLECRAGICELPGVNGGDGAIDVAIDAMVDACPAASCMGSELVGCGAPIKCPNGCSDQGGAHCMALAPSNGVTPALLAGATADVTQDDWTFDSVTGQIRNNTTELRPAGTGVINGIHFSSVNSIGVFAANSFTIAAGDHWHLVGLDPIVLYAATTITIAGELDGSAQFATRGPGGSGSNLSTDASGCRGRAGRLLGPQRAEGGGGAGGATSGGDGGASTDPGATGLGGPLCTTRATTIPLRGGSAGGAGGASVDNDGGAGGGGVALIAMASISVPAGGIVAVAGGGGRSGPAVGGAVGSSEGGGGGGGGGAILLEAPVISVLGALTANGGSGASPHVVDGANGHHASSTAAVGGLFTGPGGMARGGNGATGTSDATDGQTYFFDDGMATPTSITSRGAGGGGAAGRIEVRGTSRMLSGSTISPSASQTDPDYE